MADPMYRRIADDLREQIDSGQIEPGQQLRTEIELREHYEASRNTVRDAIKWLTTLGLVETRPGQGTFVVTKIDPFVTPLTRKEGEVAEGGQSTSYLSGVGDSLKPESSDIRVEIQGAPEHVATRLRSPWVPKWSAAMSSAMLTARRIRFRRPSTRWRSPTEAPIGY